VSITEERCPECRWPVSSGHASPEGIPCSRTGPPPGEVQGCTGCFRAAKAREAWLSKEPVCYELGHETPSAVETLQANLDAARAALEKAQLEAAEAFAVVRDIRSTIDHSLFCDRDQLVHRIMGVLDDTDIGAIGGRREPGGGK
jgi:hypothetical protein